MRVLVLLLALAPAASAFDGVMPVPVPGAAHLFALVLPQGFAPAPDFLEFASIHGRIISRA